MSRFSVVHLAAEIGRERLAKMFKEEAKLSLREAWILAAAYEIRASQQLVAEIYGINANVMVGIVDGLEKGGLLKRVRNPENRREYILQLTSKGTKTIEKIFENWRTFATQTFPPLSQAEVDAFVAYSQRIIDEYYEGKG